MRAFPVAPNFFLFPFGFNILIYIERVSLRKEVELFQEHYLNEGDDEIAF